MAYKSDDRCLKKALPQENIFTLLGRDLTSPQTILYWIRENFHIQPAEKLLEAFQTALKMRDEYPKILETLKENDKAKKDLNATMEMENEDNTNELINGALDYPLGMCQICGKTKPIVDAKINKATVRICRECGDKINYPIL